jgi:very-short-patch-repair endonuclease
VAAGFLTLKAKRAFAGEMRNHPTAGEAALWQRLQGKKTGFVFHRQSLQRGYILDFYWPQLKLAIEIDGSIHERQGRADARRERALRQRGITVLRFANREVLDFGAGVVRQVLTVISSLDSAGGEMRQPTRRTAEQFVVSKIGII